jgi:CBS domain-containing protein
MAIRDIIQKNVTVIQPEATLKDAAKLMFKNNVGTVIVVDKLNGARKTPIGIVTDRDIVLTLGKKGELDPNCSVRDLMTSNVIVCSPDDGVYETIQKMRTNRIRRIPVINSKDHLIGVIAVDDFIRLLGAELNDLSLVIDLEKKKEKNIRKPISKGKQLSVSAQA